jgi:hypothetical protein
MRRCGLVFALQTNRRAHSLSCGRSQGLAADPNLAEAHAAAPTYGLTGTGRVRAGRRALSSTPSMDACGCFALDLTARPFLEAPS